MKHFLWIGLLLGAIHSGFTYNSMVTLMPYPVWDELNTALFIVSVGALLVIAIQCAGKAWPISQILAGAAIFSIAYLGLQLAAYAIITRFLTDRLVQLPFYFQDYTYRAYVSPAEFLLTDGNYAKLIGVQAFSMLVMFVFQVALAGLVGFGAQWMINREQKGELASDVE